MRDSLSGGAKIGSGGGSKRSVFADLLSCGPKSGQKLLFFVFPTLMGLIFQFLAVFGRFRGQTIRKPES
jgi:hypothetical protein